MKTLLLGCIVSLILTVIAGLISIPLLKRLKAGQTVLKYVEEHKKKNGTPTMGGLFFIIPSVLTFFIFGGASGKVAVFCTAIGLAYMIVGFIDDFIKIKFKQNEGLKAYQKIVFQLLIAIAAGVFAYVNGIEELFLPFSRKSINLGALIVPFVTLIFIAITNSVNLTDGLDGLASSTSMVYVVFLAIIIMLQSRLSELKRFEETEYQAIYLIIFTLVGGLLGFLTFNTNRAKVFMGDTGSMSLGGFIGSLSIFTFNSLFIPILGITFVFSSISVIMQVLHYKRTKKRIFLMTPLHHHFQLKGYTEAQISYCYSLVTLLFGALLVLVYL